MRDDIECYWLALAELARNMPFSSIAEVAEILFACHEQDGTVFVLGNGGSAATASHFACDLAKGTQTPGVTPFRVMPLTDNMPLLTAWANDTSYERVFAEQLKTLVRPGDVVLVISVSGNSPNVLHAVDTANAMGAMTIALAGESGGEVGKLAALTLRVPGGSIEQVEDAHSAITHSLCVALRERLRSRAELPQWANSEPFVLELEP
ncbi:MAG: SIS domain-containing protein [Herpetosiphonaceae bacterium]|nr:SIS domain-containing protein [Herpetosiphonaceae bacterium]